MYNLAILLVARALLRICPPLRAHAILLRLAARLPQIETPAEALRVARSLAGHGTCLSRSLAVAARAPWADVVIGVAPQKGSPLLAHAWVEWNGVPLDAADVVGEAIARLPGSGGRPRRPG